MDNAPLTIVGRYFPYKSLVLEIKTHLPRLNIWVWQQISVKYCNSVCASTGKTIHYRIFRHGKKRRNIFKRRFWRKLDLNPFRVAMSVGKYLERNSRGHPREFSFTRVSRFRNFHLAKAIVITEEKKIPSEKRRVNAW